MKNFLSEGLSKVKQNSIITYKRIKFQLSYFGGGVGKSLVKSATYLPLEMESAYTCMYVAESYSEVK